MKTTQKATVIAAITVSVSLVAVGMVYAMELPEVPASFVDPGENPQYYVDRYYNEPAFKDWFDTYYSKYDSIHHAVGLSNSNSPLTSTNTTPKSDLQHWQDLAKVVNELKQEIIDLKKEIMQLKNGQLDLNESYKQLEEENKKLKKELEKIHNIKENKKEQIIDLNNIVSRLDGSQEQQEKITQAIERGASFVIVDKNVYTLGENITIANDIDFGHSFMNI